MYVGDASHHYDWGDGFGHPSFSFLLLTQEYGLVWEPPQCKAATVKTVQKLLCPQSHIKEIVYCKAVTCNSVQKSSERVKEPARQYPQK